MTANHKVDWRKTCSNISSRLSGLAWAKDVAPVFHLSIREAQHKLTGQELSVEELSLYASIFGCSIDDLLVFEHDRFVEPEHSNVSKRQKMELSTIVEITDTIDFNAKHFRNCEIQNLMEFLLYLPLMSKEVLQDVCFRCNGNLSSFDRYYFIKQMNYLYSSLPDIPAKHYADSYRDNVLRVKGDGELRFEPDKYESECYEIASLLFSEQIDYAKYQRLLEGLKNLHNR